MADAPASPEAATVPDSGLELAGRAPSPPALPFPRDVLVVFGARVRASGKPSPALRRRLEGAVAAAKRLRDPLFVVSGGQGASGPVEADVMVQTLREFGVPAEAILREPRSRDTLEQVRRVAAILDGLPEVGRVVVCTSRFHQPRCCLLLRLLGVPSEPAPMPDDRASMGTRLWLYYVLREVAATVWDVLLLGVLVTLGRGRLPG